jgi:hypothetical protein
LERYDACADEEEERGGEMHGDNEVKCFSAVVVLGYDQVV